MAQPHPSVCCAARWWRTAVVRVCLCVRSLADAAVGTQDNARQDLSPLFDEMSEFIAEGRAAGGVVVHCAAGISRATAACVAYMVQREGLSVNAAFRKVNPRSFPDNPEPSPKFGQCSAADSATPTHSLFALTQIFHIRPQVYPNEGFWRQLRDLESVLLEKGVALRELREGELRVLSEAEAPHNTDGPTVEDTIKQLDNAAGRTASFTSIALTATVTLSPTAGPAQAVELLKKWNENPATGPGIVITDYSTDDHSVSCRVRLVASRRSSAAADVRGALDEALGGPQHVEGIAVEGEIPLHTAGPSPNPKNATGNSRTVVAH